MKSLYCKTPEEWRSWLEANHDKESEIWMVFLKDNSGPTLTYDAAVEEALCFGWVDSIIKKIDTQKYVRKFTPRKEDSKWSAANKKRVEKLLKTGRMAPPGLSKINAAKKSGLWNQPARPSINFDPTEDFLKALDQNKKAKRFFAQLAPSYQRQFIAWIRVAKREETRERRIRESVQLLEKEEKLGMV